MDINDMKPDALRKYDFGKPVVKTQLLGIEMAKVFFQDILGMGISAVDVDCAEEISFELELMSDHHLPALIKDLGHFISYFYYGSVDHKDIPKVIAALYDLSVVMDQAEKYLNYRLEGGELDVNSLLEARLGYLWSNLDLLEANRAEEGTEIIQLSFNHIEDHHRDELVDKAYWFDLKTRKIYYTRKTRPTLTEKFIKKGSDTAFDVLKPEQLFIYPGRINSRVRWKAAAAKKRKLTTEDIAALHASAETNYADAICRVKESFREPLADSTPAMLIQLHNVFNNGCHLVLEDEQGTMLTVMDMPEDPTPTTDLLRAVLPAQPAGLALLVEVNNDQHRSGLFSVRPLSIITSDKIIRLLY